MKNIIKKITLLILLVTSSYINSQTSPTRINKNYNPSAKELFHDLNEAGDSLILKSEFRIYRVEFLKSDYSKNYETFKNSVEIPLYELPRGKYSVLVSTNRKMILFNIYKDEEIKSPIKVTSSGIKKDSINIDSSIKIAKNKIDSSKNNNSLFLKGKKDFSQITKNHIEGYWAVIYVNQKFGSHKTSKIINERNKNRLIEKNKHDVKSYTGYANKLIIWEVYDISSFFKYKFNQADLIGGKKSTFFNNTPIYITK